MAVLAFSDAFGKLTLPVLHRTSVIINGAQMIAVLPAFVGLVG